MTMRDKAAGAAPTIAVNSDVERRSAGSRPSPTLIMTMTRQGSQLSNGLDPAAGAAAQRCTRACVLFPLRRARRTVPFLFSPP
ncbi:MAG: hypothetical protein ACR2OO_05410, partial [Thermomicrobiales bacterium]